jgi:hypothetical protein
MGIGFCKNSLNLNKEFETDKLINQNLYEINESIIKYAPINKSKKSSFNESLKTNSNSQIIYRSTDSINNENVDFKYIPNYFEIPQIKEKILDNNIIYNDNEEFPIRIRDKKKLNYIPKENESGLIKTHYKQKILLTKNGQKIQHKITLRQVNLEGLIHHNWSFSINSNIKIEVEEIKLNGIYKFKPNTFYFQFDLENNQNIKISFTYFEIRENLLDYYRHLRVNIPNFFYNSVCNVIVKIPLHFQIISLSNNLFIKDLQDNIYLYDGIVPKEGITEIFKCSIKKAKWKGKIIQNFYIKRDFFPLIVYSYKFFQFGNNKILIYDINTNNIDNEIIIEEDQFLKFYFDSNCLEGSYKIKTIFENNIEKKYIVNNIENKIKKFKSVEEYKFFKELSQKIIEKDKSNLPNYIKLGKWVNLFLKFNSSLQNKKMTLEEIIKKKEGVGKHYTILYNTLLNSIGISSIYINGLSHNCENQIIEIENKFINHAWTLAKINNQWIPLDCTWGFFEGKLPVSHIFLNYFEYNIPNNNFIEREIVDETIEFIKD